ncbi:BLUF domain-containing protein [Paraglaciecola sp. L3A3]|uniref:BLUF domain-containing protein n=1 Tax=Paraglaciecola sp. L3A3 TaxID=2686358 RepID=UPI00131ABAB8|nr:BLUF domain-containing protein [Paraglaciecola sp. L3A3]
MYQLIYVSDKTHTFVPSDVDSILFSARKNNEKFGITGLLVELPEHFIQIIEGEKEKVEHVFQLIAKDERHENLRVLLAMKTLSREMAAWAMGFSEKLSESQLRDALHILNSFSKKQNFSDIHGKSIKLLLKSLSPE